MMIMGCGMQSQNELNLLAEKFGHLWCWNVPQQLVEFFERHVLISMKRLWFDRMHHDLVFL